MRKNILKILATIIISTFCFCSEDFEYNTGAKLNFSSDTLKFDTVFTGEKSSIRYLKIFNNTDKNININTIHLENNDNQIHLNINGIETTSAENIELRKNDSIFVFAQAELKNQTENYSLTNSLIVNTGGENQRVIITAYAINVEKLDGTINSDTTLPENKSYISHSGVKVAKNAKLTIKEGVSIYFGKESGIEIEGALNIEGTIENPVKFQGIRSEKEYAEIPAQWRGINFKEESQTSVINCATIKNTQTAVSAFSNANITISNSKIENSFYHGLYLENTNSQIYNTLIHNCGYSCINISGTGNYQILHCTLADYWNYNFREKSAFDCKGSEQNFSTLVVNSIIYGNKTNETDFREKDNINIVNCLIKSDLTENEKFTNCKFNLDPEFANPDSANYKIKDSSPAVDMANYGMLMLDDFLETDYYGNQRTEDDGPDAGFAEYIK